MKKFICIIFVLVLLLSTCYATEINIDNKKLEFENPIYTFNGLTYVPLRELFEKKDYSVSWRGENDLIEIQSKKYPLYNEDLSEREGVVKKNLKYKFIGDNKFTINDSGNSFDRTDDQIYSYISNAEEAAEIGSVYLSVGIKNLQKTYGEEAVVLDVAYSSKLNAWYVSYRPADKNVYSHRSGGTVIFSANDGRVLKIYAGI